MKRNMDEIRDLLFEIEAGTYNIENDVEDADKDVASRSYQLVLMYQAGLISGRIHRGRPNRKGADLEELKKMNIKLDYITNVIPWALTWEGHEYLDSIRDPDIWNKAKTSAKTVGDFGFETLSALAKGFIRTKIQQHTGIEL